MIRRIHLKEFAALTWIRTADLWTTLLIDPTNRMLIDPTTKLLLSHVVQRSAVQIQIRASFSFMGLPS